mmetsp:Transcript_2289/g.3205  ORF Transcript_2289/g.3205 Transcript_2289/m.3205 type:complete len:99 (+) Transcript_2289:1-297(+)
MAIGSLIIVVDSVEHTAATRRKEEGGGLWGNLSSTQVIRRVAAILRQLSGGGEGSLKMITFAAVSREPPDASHLSSNEEEDHRLRTIRAAFQDAFAQR